MKIFFLTGLLISATPFLSAQDIDAIITTKETDRIERTLSADDMQGRRPFTPGIEKAADFIAAEFKAAGLVPWNNTVTYRQEFTMVRTKFISAAATFDGISIDQKNIIAVTCQPKLNIVQDDGYEKVFVKAGANLQTEARKFIRSNKNMLVLVDKSFSNSFGNLARLKSSMFKRLLFVLEVANFSDKRL